VLRTALALIAAWLAVCANEMHAGVWVSNGPNGGSVFGFVIDPTNAGVMYASSNMGLFKTTDGGASWSNLGNHAGLIAIDPTNPTTIYANGIDKSTDGGASWTKTPLSVGGPIYALVIDPTSPSTLYVGVGYDGVFKTTDGGASWAAANVGLTTTDVRALVI